ncbi:MAG: VOC family protein [Defluviitaleaceae bacterium]|nr:VOC family protein [Defluviitaleaceae bacterium]MCL2262671.1 VOC family protein [Defluviitaleaceae bacterium]
MLNPSIHFNGNCDEAIAFYKTALAADVKEINYAKDAPPNSGMDDCPPNFVMHSEVIIHGVNFSLTDGAETPPPFGNFSYMITYDTEAEVRATFEKLAAGGKVEEPLATVFWSPLYGSVVDRFGVNWQVMVTHP